MLLLFIMLSLPAYSADRLDMEGAEIKGTRELPKVLYIVPWKKSNLGELSGSTGGDSLKDELKGLDRNVFLRQLKYQNVLEASEVALKK